MPTPTDYTELQLNNPPNISEDQAMPTHLPAYPGGAFADVQISSTPRFNRHDYGREENEIPAAPEGLLNIPADGENQGS
jgi:hypothetical protein